MGVRVARPIVGAPQAQKAKRIHLVRLRRTDIRPWRTVWGVNAQAAESRCYPRARLATAEKVPLKMRAIAVGSGTEANNKPGERVPAPLSDSTKEVKAGEIPQFGANLVY